MAMTWVNIRQMRTLGVLAPHPLWFLTGQSCPEEPWGHRDVRVYPHCNSMPLGAAWVYYIKVLILACKAS